MKTATKDKRLSAMFYQSGISITYVKCLRKARNIMQVGNIHNVTSFINGLTN